MFFEILKKYRNDIILIVVMIALSLSSWFIISANKTEGGSVVIMVDGKEYARYPLNTDRKVVIDDGDNYNILVIKNGVASISDASCPDKLCMNQGDIHYNSETITCLPNKVVVKIISDVEPEVDFYS